MILATIIENALTEGTRLAGVQADQYEIVSVLGAGGFGITYLGRDHLLADDVAIKEYLPAEIAVRRQDGSTIVPRNSTLSEDYQFGLERFLDEARTLKRFRNRSIVRVENFLEANGSAYLVMEYEDGETLDTWLASRSMDEAQLKALFIPLLEGLRAVHDADYLHRDIKPGNIYIRRDGSPVLLDFGAARQALGDHSRSITGVLTDGYAPFEQYGGRMLTPAADLYAIGATLYKCLTGKTPPSAPLRIEARQLGEADPLDPASRRCAGRYSESLIRLVDDLLEPLSRDRPQSASEVVERMIGDDLAAPSQLDSDRAQIPEPQKSASPPPTASAEGARPGTMDGASSEPVATQGTIGGRWDIAKPAVISSTIWLLLTLAGQQAELLLDKDGFSLSDVFVKPLGPLGVFFTGWPETLLAQLLVYGSGGVFCLMVLAPYVAHDAKTALRTKVTLFVGGFFTYWIAISLTRTFGLPFPGGIMMTGGAFGALGVGALVFFWRRQSSWIYWGRLVCYGSLGGFVVGLGDVDSFQKASIWTLAPGHLAWQVLVALCVAHEVASEKAPRSRKSRIMGAIGLLAVLAYVGRAAFVLLE